MYKNLYIPWDGWQVVKRLGNGSYGAVYEIQRRIYGETESAAVKIINIPKDASEIELLRASGYDHRADIYSLGIVLYWLLNDCLSIRYKR